MSEKEWLDKAEHYDRKAQEKYDKGDECLGEMYEQKRDACRYNACNAPVGESDE